jgi:hypothetical protein
VTCSTLETATCCPPRYVKGEFEKGESFRQWYRFTIRHWVREVRKCSRKIEDDRDGSCETLFSRIDSTDSRERIEGAQYFSLFSFYLVLVINIWIFLKTYDTFCLSVSFSLSLSLFLTLSLMIVSIAKADKSYRDRRDFTCLEVNWKHKLFNEAWNAWRNQCLRNNILSMRDCCFTSIA